MVAVNSGDAIVLGEPLVEKGVIGAEQLLRTAIAQNLALQEQAGFRLKVRSQAVVELRKSSGVRRDAPDFAKPQPLSGKILDQSARSRIPKHALYLMVQNLWILEPAGNC